MFLAAFFVQFITKSDRNKIKTAAGEENYADRALSPVSAYIKTLLRAALGFKFQYIPYFLLLIVKDQMYGIDGNVGYAVYHDTVRTLFAKVHIIKLHGHVVTYIIYTVRLFIKAVTIYMIAVTAA